MGNVSQWEVRRVESISLLERWRIPVENVCADDWDRAGYRVPNTETRRYWPAGFPVDKLIQIRGGISK